MPTSSTTQIGLTQTLVERALKLGATDAEATMLEGDEFFVKVRLGHVDTLTESVSRAIGLRVFNGKRTASTSTNDFSDASLTRLVQGAVELSKLTEEDPYAGLADPADFAEKRDAEGMGLYFDDVYSLPAAERIDMARAVEAAAMAADTRIQNSDGGNFSAATSHRATANSRGFAGSYRKSYVSLGTTPIAQDASGMQRDGWSHSARTLHKLETPEQIGREAAKRAIRRLGARRVPTQKATMVFDRQVARGIIGDIFDAVNGEAVYRHSTMFEDMLGKQVASPLVTVVDDGTMMLEPGLGGFGTLPFDGDGLPMQRKVIVQDGILQTWITNTYTGRKLGLPSTGNASRGLSGAPGIGSGNFYLQPGTQTLRELIANVQCGLYVTETLGSGVNLVTGDYSQGASGLWIEHGEFTGAVEEITIAGNLKEMYKNITAIANDLTFRGAAASPAIRVEGMTIAGA